MDEPPGSSSAMTDPYGATDPVVGIIRRVGLFADPKVHECESLAAAAQQYRFEHGRADNRAVSRSTFVWALWKLDDAVKASMQQNSVKLDAFERLLGISESPKPFTGRFELREDLTRALMTWVDTPAKTRLTVTPAMLGVAVLEDAVANGGPLSERLRRLGADPRAILDTLQRLITDGPPTAPSEPPASPESQTPDAHVVRVRDLTPRRFGVHLPEDVEIPGPYVPRDVDAELDLLLSQRSQEIAVMASPVSGAIRTVYEALRRGRLDSTVLLLHELLDSEVRGQIGAENVDGLLTSDADVVWIRNVRELMAASPEFVDRVRQLGDRIEATFVYVVRPEDRERAADLGLLTGAVVELTGGLTAAEQARAREFYKGDLDTVPAIANAATRRPAVVRANYAADSAAAAELLDADRDDLAIRADVDMLAKLIASKDVYPPLSIGLFGAWGSGKSFLMRQVQLRIADLADRSREMDDESASGYLREVVPVEFNAWQYAHGSSLWAALINRVFEEIQDKLGGDARYQKVLRDIADKNVGVAKAHSKVDDARAKVEQSRPAAADRVIQQVANEHEIAESATSDLAKGLNLDATTKQVSDLRNEYDRLITTSSRLGMGWSSASVGRRVLAIVLVASGLALVVTCLVVPGAFEQVATLVAGLAAIMTAAVQVLKPVNQGLKQAAKVLRADDTDKQELQQSLDELDRANQELTAAKASGLAGLYGFVNDRSSAAEYRQHLGMAPMIRDDLERLAAMSRKDNGLPGIDRIVIFIDDLDRCPASEVVRVLEAVNLLFGFELFVVVVAVDSRWLLRSLVGTFSEAFDADDSSAPTPQNYLEKIIQIPFWLQPMRPTGFERLVTSLAGEVDRVPGSAGARAGQADGSGVDSGTGAGLQPNSGFDPGSGSDSDDVIGPLTGSPFHTEEPPAGQGSAASSGNAPTSAERGGGEPADEENQSSPEDDLNPAALRLTEPERDFMLLFFSLVGTPRAVKRFLNTYQLLRVSVDDVDAFLDSHDYEPVLILLALVTGTAPITDAMVDELRVMTEVDFGVFLQNNLRGEVTTSRRIDAWTPIASACAGLPVSTLTPDVIKAWLPKVARYSFHPIKV